MHLIIENTTRFFSVVGAPYIPESNFDDPCCERTTHARPDHDSEPVFAPAATGWWPQDCR